MRNIPAPDVDLHIIPPGSIGRTRHAARMGDGPITMGDRPIVIGDRPIVLGDRSIVMGDFPFPMGTSSRRILMVGVGYHSDLPDRRDFDVNTIKKRISPTHSKAINASYLFTGRKIRRSLKDFDLRRKNGRFVPWPVENQGPLQSCTAHAVIGMVEFLIQQGCGDIEDLSRLFLYKVTRQFLGWSGDSGANIRSTVRCAGIFGMPPEEYWPYDIAAYDIEPNPFLFSFAQSYHALMYARLDGYGDDGTTTLERVKRALLDGFPVAFGFPVYNSLNSISPDVPIPTQQDKLIGGHAVLAVGYDNDHEIDGEPGCLIFRNSWGPQWGKEGYGYLPYKYVKNQWAVDFWTIFRQSWLNPKQFGQPVAPPSARVSKRAGRLNQAARPKRSLR